LRLSKAIRPAAWALVAAGVAAPALRRRIPAPKAAVLGAAALAPAALTVALPRSRLRDGAVVFLQMWAYLAAYEMPHDDPEALHARVHVRYPVEIDRKLGLGQIPSQRLQHWFTRQGEIRRFERGLVWSHWVWFAVPHLTVAYIYMRRGDKFSSAAARMYAVFDLGALVYWTLPTAPPWYAAEHGELGPVAEGLKPVRRIMREYGEDYWGKRWNDLYDILGGNPLAAMPSLHFATSVMGASLLSEVDPVAGTVGWAYAGTLGFALVYLGEHYLVDLIAGAALAGLVRAGAGPASGPARRLVRGLNRLNTAASGG
jgi:membrane-associated phospholipid phosphatase